MRARERRTLCTVLAVVRGAGEYNVSVFNLNGEVGIYFLGEFALGALHGDVVAVDGDSHSCGYFNGCFTYS